MRSTIISLLLLTGLGIAISVGKTLQPVAAKMSPVTTVQTPTPTPPAPFGRFVENINGVPLELVRVPAGSFVMGNDRSPNPEEKPAHLVNVKSFFIGQYEVTREQWNMVADTLPRINRSLDRQYIGPLFGELSAEPKSPADFMFWDQANEFCDRLTRYTGRRYRLPSESEWEYACRAGTQTEYSFGDQFDRMFANLEFVSDWMLPVGKLGYANAWGLFDMHGNAHEWVQDREHSNYVGAPTDGSAWVQGGNQNGRILRGGRFRWKSEVGRSSSRFLSLVSIRATGDGLRVVAEILPTIGSGSIATASAANYSNSGLASESIAALFGSNLSGQTQVAASAPLPLSLTGASVFIKDSRGNEFASPLFFASPNQINFQVPSGLALGPATIYAVNNGNIHSTGSIEITGVSPGLFTADASGAGLAAATVLRIKANGQQVYEPVARFDLALNRFVATPIEVGNPAEQAYLLAFGTGFRRRSDLANVSARIGDVPAEVLFAGAQGGFVGLDQCNIRLSPNLAGRGEVAVVLTVDGKAANTVRIAIR